MLEMNVGTLSKTSKHSLVLTSIIRIYYFSLCYVIVM